MTSAVRALHMTDMTERHDPWGGEGVATSGPYSSIVSYESRMVDKWVMWDMTS